MYIALQQAHGETERTMAGYTTIYRLMLPNSSLNVIHLGIAHLMTANWNQFLSPLPPQNLQQTAALSHWQPSEHDPTGVSYSGDSGKLGSNNWAVSGKLTPHGSAMLAGDMHLGIRAPNTWYRASIHYQDKHGKKWDVTGVTLPGTPIMISTSNRHVAWAFTNSYGDWTDD